MLADIEEVLTTYRVFWPLTARQIGYRLLGLPRYRKTERHFSQIGEVINRARRAGMIPWEAIRDDSVSRRGDGGYSGLGDLRNVFTRSAEGYRRKRQAGQPHFLEVWCEAAGMVPQVAAMTRSFGVPVVSSSGFDSTTIKRRIGLEIADRDVPTVIGVIGDHDPHGLSVIDSRADDVAAFVDDYVTGYESGSGQPFVGSVTFVWLAVRGDQIDALELETAPHPEGKQRPGDNPDAVLRTVQAEAIDPPDLRRIVRWFLAAHLDASHMSRSGGQSARNDGKPLKRSRGSTSAATERSEGRAQQVRLVVGLLRPIRNPDSGLRMCRRPLGQRGQDSDIGGWGSVRREGGVPCIPTNVGSDDNLAHADLRWADLWSSDLRQANLAEADLMEAILARADLTHADLSNANLAEANLRQ